VTEGTILTSYHSLTPSSPVVTLRHDRVLEIRLNRPPVNAVNKALSEAVYAALKVLQDDPTLSAGLLTAEGARAFCGGWDLNDAAIGGVGDTTAHSPGGFGGITEFIPGVYSACRVEFPITSRWSC
jgi:enoyl-CoA hydratase/carnithine racemase